jgi:hypothetical protein
MHRSRLDNILLVARARATGVMQRFDFRRLFDHTRTSLAAHTALFGRCLANGNFPAASSPGRNLSIQHYWTFIGRLARSYQWYRNPTMVTPGQICALDLVSVRSPEALALRDSTDRRRRGWSMPPQL